MISFKKENIILHEGIPKHSALLMKVLLEKIYTMAVGYVRIIDNTTVYVDEVIVHRLAMIPIYCSDIDDFSYHKDCTCLEKEGYNHCRKCSLKFAISILKSPVARTVTNKDLTFEDSRCYVFEDYKIPLLHIKKGESIILNGYITKGRGEDHAKWSPVAAISIKHPSSNTVLFTFEDNKMLPPSNLTQQIKSQFKQCISQKELDIS